MCTKTTTRRALSAAVVLWSVATTASAAPVSCFAVPHLQALVDLGHDGCDAGARRVFDVTYATTVSGGAVDVAADAVSVEFPSTRFGQGLSFTGKWVAAPGQTLEGEIAYRFSQIRVHEAGFGFEALVPTASGAVSMRGTLCVGDADPCPSGALLELPAFIGVSLPPGVSSGRVRLFFSLEGPAPPEIDVTLVRVHSGFAVPEPSLLALACVSVGRAWCRRRRRVD